MRGEERRGDPFKAEPRGGTPLSGSSAGTETGKPEGESFQLALKVVS